MSLAPLPPKPLPPAALAALATLCELMPALTVDQRLELFDAVAEGYCKHCGNDSPVGKCYCWNDE